MASSVQLYLKEKKRRKQKLKILALAAAAAALLVAACYGLFFSPYFVVRDTSVNGVEQVSRDDVVRIVSGFLEQRTLFVLSQRNIFFFPTAAAERAIGALSPRIASVRVRTHLFARTVSVDIAERHIFGITCGEGTHAERCYFFDETGMLFAEAPLIEGAANLLIRSTDIVPGIALPAPLLHGPTVRYFKELKQATERVGVILDSFALRGEYGDATAHATAGFDILFTMEREPKAYAEVLGVLFAKEIQDQAAQLEYIDLRVEDRAYYKFRAERSATTSLEMIHKD